MGQGQVEVIVEDDGNARVPVAVGAGVPVATIVDTAHEQSIAGALARWSSADLTPEALESVLVYCAEQRCKADDATCPGCRLRTERLGLKSFDDFAAQFSEVTFTHSAIRIPGAGSGTYAAQSLEHLAATWSGVEYWFWARRVLRKLRHGIRRAGQSGAPPADSGQTPVLILVRPQLADNIGMVARAMANFGLDDLRLVAPRDGWPNEKARIAASGANYIIDDAVDFPTLEAAISDFNWLAATTARQRDLRKPVLTPIEAVAEMRRRIAAGERCGVLFGRERSGLETLEVANADALIMIPVNSRFASLNLAQAVLILGYEWMRGSDAQSLGRVTTYEKPLEGGLYMGDDRPATKDELLGFFNHIEGELERLGFFNPSHRRATVVRNLRTMFSRMGATEQEVRTLRGIVATLVKGKGNARKTSN